MAVSPELGDARTSHENSGFPGCVPWPQPSAGRRATPCSAIVIQRRFPLAMAARCPWSLSPVFTATFSGLLFMDRLEHLPFSFSLQRPDLISQQLHLLGLVTFPLRAETRAALDPSGGSAERQVSVTGSVRTSPLPEPRLLGKGQATAQALSFCDRMSTVSSWALERSSCKGSKGINRGLPERTLTVGLYFILFHFRRISPFPSFFL